MIRLVQRKLIIPRGDTGSFSIPAIAAASSGDVAIFTIFDYRTHTKLFEKMVEITGQAITFNFNHNDTVNLVPGEYVWDVKFYKEPVFADGKLINGIEIDSYYAGFKLPECEIRETGDNLLVSSDAPGSSLTPAQLNIISTAVEALNEAVRQTASNVEHYPTIIDNVWYLWNVNAGEYVSTGVHANCIAGGTTGQVYRKHSDVDYDAEWGDEIDPTVPAWAKEPTKPTYTAAEVGALANDTFIPTNTSDLNNDSNFAVDANYVHTDNNYTTEEKNKLSGIAAGAEVNVNADWNAVSGDAQILNKPTIPSKVSDLIDDSGHYTKPVSGIPAADIAAGVIPDISGKADKVNEAVNGNFASLDSNGNLVDSGHKHSDYLTQHQDISGKLDATLKGVANGLAELDAEGKVPSSQLPSYVDDILEYATASSFPVTGETGKIYVAQDTNLTYRWSGSDYVEISQSLALGTTSFTAYRGDYGDAAYAHGVTNKGSAFASGLYKITTNSEGHVTAAAEVQKSDITGLGIPAQDTTYESKSAANAGTDVSLVTTGEKYSWNNKVDSVSGKGLSTNDFTDAYKDKVDSALQSHQDISGKADKVASATNGNFAALDSNGNLTDSGHKHSDYLTEHQTIPVTDVQINGTSILSSGVANVPIASPTVPGAVIVRQYTDGLYIDSNNRLGIYRATSAQMKAGTEGSRAIAPYGQHESIFYGLAKAAGDTTQSQSDNSVGTYTDSAKASIQHMLGTDTNLAPYESDTIADAAYAVGEMFMLNGKLHHATAAIAVGDTLTIGTNCAVVNAAEVFPHDVQVDGTSVITNGVANIPAAGHGNISSSTLGVVKGGYGVKIGNNGTLIIDYAYAGDVKNGTSTYLPITPSTISPTAFYGLAKAAGDATQSSSNNAVGTYTETAKSKIAEMLNAPETITGTTPSITGKAGIRYICGECTTLTISPPAAGDIEVIFESGTTATVLTITPPTGITAVKWPSWFDPTDLDTSCIYDIIITNGEYGVVTSWA